VIIFLNRESRFIDDPHPFFELFIGFANKKVKKKGWGVKKKGWGVVEESGSHGL